MKIKKKRLTIFALSACLMLSACSKIPPGPSRSSQGTQNSFLGSQSGSFLPPPTEEPDACGIVQKRVIISTPEQLVALAQLVNSGDLTHAQVVYELGEDLDMAGISMPPIGGGGSPLQEQDLPAFLGSFDGKGHTIRRLTVDRPQDWGVGLFGRLGEGASVVNLILEDVQVTGHGQVGGLAGQVSGGVIRACKVYDGTITGQTQVGGMVGELTEASGRGSELSLCTSAAMVTGNHAVGGLVGNAVRSTVSNSRADGAVLGVTRTTSLEDAESIQTGDVQQDPGMVRPVQSIGGFIGVNDGGSLSQCYTVALLQTPEQASQVGGFAGENGGSLINCVLLDRGNDIAPLGLNRGEQTAPLLRTEEEMTSVTGFPSWDFETVWDVETGRGFPHLRWDSASCNTFG